MILGQGHLLHCTLFQVFAFDRSSHSKTDFQTKNATFSANGILNDKQQQEQPTNNSTSSLPSSFAFYVFIKESFRFLCFHLRCMVGGNNILNEGIDSHLETSLETDYRFGVQMSADNFLLSNNTDNKKTKKAMERMIKEKEKSMSKAEKRKSIGSILEASLSSNGELIHFLSSLTLN